MPGARLPPPRPARRTRPRPARDPIITASLIFFQTKVGKRPLLPLDGHFGQSAVRVPLFGFFFGRTRFLNSVGGREVGPFESSSSSTTARTARKKLRVSCSCLEGWSCPVYEEKTRGAEPPYLFVCFYGASSPWYSSSPERSFGRGSRGALRDGNRIRCIQRGWLLSLQ